MAELAANDFTITESTPSALTEFISRTCELDSERASALVWGEPAELTSRDIDALADTFDLERDLLACVLLPMSAELIQFTLARIADRLDGEDCDTCASLISNISDAQMVDDTDNLRGVCVAVMSHMAMAEAADDLTGLDLWGSDEEFIANATDPVVDELLAAVRMLPRDAVRRVLLYAHHEAAQLSQEAAIDQIASFSRLRDQLTPFARTVFTTLAQQDDGALGRRRIVECLALPNERPIAHLAATVAESVQAAVREGARFAEAPLTVDETHVRLSAEARLAWRQLLRAEQHLEAARHTPPNTQ